MSQRYVEQIVGRLVTDEGFRSHFGREPEATLRQLVDHGAELNPCEFHALANLDLARIQRFADDLDPCILKIQLRKPSS